MYNVISDMHAVQILAGLTIHCVIIDVLYIGYILFTRFIRVFYDTRGTI